DQLIDQAVVEVEALQVGLPGAVGEDARPGDREAIRPRPDLPHEPDVLLVAMVVIIGDVAGVAVLDLSRRWRVRIPDRRSLAVLVPRAFDLVRGRRNAPEEALRKLAPIGRHKLAR